MDGTSMMSNRYELKPAKKVFLYRNGVTDSEPKCMVVNDRQVRDFSTFLNRATSGLRAPVAIRNIYTPSEGHRVKTLNDLQPGRYYVAGGSEHFKKVKYGSEGKRLLTRRQPKAELVLPPRGLAKVIVATSRYKRPIEKPFVIHVFRNGDERYRGARILIPRRMMGSWEYVLEVVTEKSNLITPAKRLCTLDGRLLHAVSEIQDGGKYVALEGRKPFQKVSYCAIEEKKSPLRAAATIPRTIRRLKRLPPRPRAAKQVQEEEPASKPVIPAETMKHKILERRKSRPFAGRKNKAGREKAIEDHRADSIFGGSPVRAASPAEPLATVEDSPLATSQSPKTLDTPVEDRPLPTSSPVAQISTDTAVEEEVIEDLSLSLPGGDFEQALNQSNKEDSSDRAKLPHDETGTVEEVLESGDTEVEKPVELEEAQEVTEEVDDEGQKYGTANEQAIKELESQPLQTSVDLSLQRHKQQKVSTEQSRTHTPTETDNGIQTTALSTRNSATSERSKHSSRKTSATKSRPPSVDKVNPSRTHSVLNASRPESKAIEEISENNPSSLDVPQVSTDQENESTTDKNKVEGEEVKTDGTTTPVQTDQQGTDEESINQASDPAETNQADNSTDNQEGVPAEEVPREDTADTGGPTEQEATFVIEDAPTETQS